MKIAIIGPAHPYKGGSAQHTTELAHRLSAAGHQVTLVSWHSQYPKFLYPGQLTVDSPEVELFPATERPLAWYRPDGWWLTGRRLAARKFDAVIVTIFTPIQVPAYIALAKAARAGGCRVIALCHNVLPHERRKVDEPAMRVLLRSSDAVIVHSAAEAALAATLTSVPVEVAALPLHLPRMDSGPAGPAPATASAGAASSLARGPERPAAGRLLFFGIVRRYEGLDILLRALAEVKPDVSLTVAGEIWEGRDEISALIAELQLGDRVSLTDGYVAAEDVPALFSAADALVLPYRSGTASQNALIALQLGVPVIATRAGAIADAVIDGVNGLLCEPGNASDLKRAIDSLYEPGTLDRLRHGIRPADVGKAWADYLTVVERSISPRRDASPAR
jgi:glycosyltransferase involved in cell wall biosynthesis